MDKKKLHAIAEENLSHENKINNEDLENLSIKDVKIIIHDLKVHQIELEMQNEELMRIQYELDLAKARYFDIYDLAPEGYIIMSEKNIIMESNLTAATMFGLERNDLQKQKFSQFIFKDDQDIFYTHRKSLFETKDPNEWNLRINLNDDSIMWCHIKAILVEENGVPFCRMIISDITKQIDDLNKLEESEKKYRLLSEVLPLGMAHYEVVRDEKKNPINYKFLGVNNVFEHIFGVKNEEIIGKYIWDLYPETEQHWIDAYEHVANSGETYIFEDYTKASDRYLKIYGYKIDVDKIAFIIQDVTEERKKEQEINYISYHDPLTNLYNRRFFEEQLKRLDNPRNLPLSVIMGDVNGLKLVNDAFGHNIGDQLLKLIGDIISNSIRANDIAARWGGDEFTILMPSSDTDAAQVLINRIHQKLEESTFDYGTLSISFGVETKRNKDEDINDLFRSAEMVMYQNKLVEVDSIRGETINTIMNTLFEKSAEIKEHSTRVSKLAVSIAENLGLSKTSVNDIRTIGMIHDIGKIAIDLHILDKPDKLTDDEMKIIQQHPLSGSRMLNSSHEYSRLAIGVLHHHERIDGNGYPNGISGDQIPIESKIIAVADAFDAMTAARPYRLNPLSLEEAIAELQKYSGTQFDSEIVKVFVDNYIEITKK